MKQFEHISEVWSFLDECKTLKEVENAITEIPNKFGDFSITNKDTYKEDGFIEIDNYYFDYGIGDYDDDFHCIEIE